MPSSYTDSELPKTPPRRNPQFGTGHNPLSQNASPLHGFGYNRAWSFDDGDDNLREDPTSAWRSTQPLFSTTEDLDTGVDIDYPTDDDEYLSDTPTSDLDVSSDPHPIPNVTSRDVKQKGYVFVPRTTSQSLATLADTGLADTQTKEMNGLVAAFSKVCDSLPDAVEVGI